MKYIKIIKKDKFGYITITNEKHLNALNKNLLEELSLAIDNLNLDNAIRVIILTGQGNKAFAAGADIKEMHGMTKEDAFKYSKLGSEIFYKIETLNKPVIAVFHIEPDMCFPLVAPGKPLHEMILNKNDLEKINKQGIAPN